MSEDPMYSPSQLLDAYDHQLRTDAETPSAIAVSHIDEIRLVTFAGGRGFVTYPKLSRFTAADFRRLVPAALDHFRHDPLIDRVEWKTRGHDRTPGLIDALEANGFIADEAETIMIGQASDLAVHLTLPPGVSLRTVTDERDVRAMSALQDRVFGDPVSVAMADAVLRRLARDDGMELWVAEIDGTMISAGRLEPVPGTEFAGIWGGVTAPEWRGRGIYRALTAARARSAIALGKTLIHSDSTEFSRPILEKSGLVAVSTTTPYRWTSSAAND